jgi:Uma2 family endonuclease
MSAGPVLDDRRIVVRGVDRDLYNRLDEAIDENQHICLAYDGKDLELMVPGYFRERYRESFRSILRAVMLGLGVDHETGRRATWKSEGADRGLQADLSYYFNPEKLRIAREAVARRSNDMADYPAPDLAIEIDISSPGVDRPVIYAALGVIEVWRFDGETVVIEHLQPDGTYAPAASSRFLPIGQADIRRWLVEEDSSHLLTWERRLNQWAMGLAGRVQQDG